MFLLGIKTTVRLERGFRATQAVFLVLGFFLLMYKIKLMAQSNNGVLYVTNDGFSWNGAMAFGLGEPRVVESSRGTLKVEGEM